jgi:hypothetical protein
MYHHATAIDKKRVEETADQEFDQLSMLAAVQLPRFSSIDALSISIGVLGGVATLMTATVLTVPVWVVFIAWASFFILGAGTDGMVRSIASNLTGIAIASLTLLVIEALGGGVAVAAIAVGVGSAAMVQASKVGLLSKIPAIVWGFASTVGTVAATGRGITTASIENPALVAALSMVLGAVFGAASEYWGPR